MVKFRNGDIVINIDTTSPGHGSYGKVFEIRRTPYGHFLVIYIDQYGNTKKFYDYRLALKKKREIKMYGIAKFCMENYK